MFLELLWWSRPYAFYGVPATDPKRLAFFAVLLLVGLVLGALAVRGGRGLPVYVKLAATVLVPVCWIGGGGYLTSVSSAGEERGSPNERNRELPNVVLFVVDALRDDVIGAYGSTEVRTPVIDDLAARGVVFENTFVQAPFTWTSFGSILTGKYPRRHGLVKMAPGVRMLPVVTLPVAPQVGPAELRRAARDDGDYVGATFMTGTLSHGSGLSRGFDVYYEALVGHELVRLDSPWSKFRSELLLSLMRATRLCSSSTRPARRQRGGRLVPRARAQALLRRWCTSTRRTRPTIRRQEFRDHVLRSRVRRTDHQLLRRAPARHRSAGGPRTADRGRPTPDPRSLSRRDEPGRRDDRRGARRARAPGRLAQDARGDSHLRPRRGAGRARRLGAQLDVADEPAASRW